MRRAAFSCAVFLLALSGLAPVRAQDSVSPAPSPEPSPGVTRTYYIAADELDWNYMPGGRDGMMPGMATHYYAKFYSEHSPRLIGPVYRKAVYREYTDGTFSHLKARAPQDAYLGTIGPIIRAEVGDTIRVVFRNHGTHPYSVHTHGVKYERAFEGAGPAGPGQPFGGGAVPPGKTFTYVYSVPERAGPGPNDPSSIVWLYHSHTDERRDVNSGLIGAMVITRKGMALPDGRPKDVDREMFALFMVYDENRSWFLDQNIARFVKDRKKFSKLESAPLDPDGNFDPLGGTKFVAANFRSTINGYQYSSGPRMEMKRGDRVRWYVFSLGEGFNFHTPHWHGNTVLVGGQRTDVVLLGPASMITADMLADNPGTWMVHCHLSEHMEFGMVAQYRVAP